MAVPSIDDGGFDRAGNSFSLLYDCSDPIDRGKPGPSCRGAGLGLNDPDNVVTLEHEVGFETFACSNMGNGGDTSEALSPPLV